VLLPFIIAGLSVGAVYGLAGVGLVLTYRTSGLFNFAHGAVATVAAYVLYSLMVQGGVSWPLAALITILGMGTILGLLFERLARVIAGRSLALGVTSTVGILLIVEALVVLVYGQGQVRTVPVFIAHGQFEIAGATVQYSDLVTFLFAVVSTVVLYLFLRTTRMGKAMRAVVDNPDLLEIAGTNATAVRRYAWVIGIVFACACGVLLAPVLPLDPVLLTLLVVQAFGAAALGAFRSLPLTFAGGLLIGVLASLATNYLTTGILAGLPPALPFLVLVGVLLVVPRRYLAERSLVVPTARSTWATPAPVQVGGGLVLLAFLAVVPSFAGPHIIDWTVAVAMVLLFLSLGLLVRTAGQVSLCHVSFMAIGAVAFAHLTGSLGIPWVPALVLSALVAVPVGALLAIPAIRLSPLYLALATFGFGIFVQYVFYTQNFMFGGTGAGLVLPRPTWLGLGSDTGFYYVVLALAVAASIAVMILNRSRLGRLLRGMADSPTAVATSGVATKVTWVLVFCLSAALAAAAGALAGAAQQTVGADSYPPLLSLQYLALIVIVPGGVPWYAVIAGLGFALPPAYIAGANTPYWLQLLFGVSAVAYALMPDSAKGAPAGVRRFFDARFRKGGRGEVAAPTAADLVPALVEAAPGELAVKDITVRFGGLVAVKDVSVIAPSGRITGLIGPNGAGKTTTFNVCSGLTPPTHGHVWLDGKDISRASSTDRARRGIGRTFQQMQLFDSLTVRQNVAMGAEGVLAGVNPFRHVFSRRRDGAVVRTSVAQALELCELTDLQDQPAAELSTGQRRLLELARCVAGPFRIFLLDEPSSGLDRTETAKFGQILRRLVNERGIGVLLVEHDMSLVMAICEYIYVLDFGSMIYEGVPRAVRESSVVRAAYLGDEAVEDGLDARSGAVSGSEAQ
jgi:ABC-type branched-subunit amino acid transport system ATPase component/branched-subunit amino acid ABC-type transport system permease component